VLIGDPWFYVVAVPAVIIAGIGKTGFGGGLGVIAVPLMSLVISPIQAAAIMLPILCIMDLFGVWAYRGLWDKRNIAIMVPGSLIGIAFGTLTFGYVSVPVVRILIGVLAITFTLHHFLLHDSERTPSSPNLVLGGLSGALAAYTSFVAHAGGPPVQAYLLPQRMDKSIFVGTTVVFFFAINYLKIVPYGIVGQWTAENVATALFLGLLAPLGVWVGFRVHKIVPERPFYRFVYVLLFCVGLKLLWDGAWAFL